MIPKCRHFLGCTRTPLKSLLFIPLFDNLDKSLNPVPQVLSEVITAAGFDAKSLIEETQNKEIKEKLKENTNR